MKTSSNNWKKTWFTTGALFLLCVVCAEFALRSVGYFPEIDDRLAWANLRGNASDDEGKVIALLGDSRMVYNISTETLHEQYPGYHIAQLALVGKSPLAVLEDLANDPKFKGIVICAVSCDRLRSIHQKDQQEYVDYYHKGKNRTEGINRKITAFFQTYSVMLRSEKKIMSIGRTILRSQPLGGRSLVHNFPDRSGGVNLHAYKEKDLLQMVDNRKKREEKSTPITPADWLHEAMKTEPLVQKIQSRGGRVIFIRMPTSEEYLEIEYRQYPKTKYWDRFEAVTSAETIHFENIAALKNFDLPDRSHIDITDKPRFTQVVLDEINSLEKNSSFRSNRIARKKNGANSSRVQ